MQNVYYMFTKTSEKWPLQLFHNDTDTEPLTNLEDIRKSIIENNGLYYINTNKNSEKKQFIYRSQITSIYGHYSIPDKESLTLDQVMSLNEAAARWQNISSVDTIRKAINANRFHEWEVRKSESIWLITYAALIRLYGPESYMNTPKDQILTVQKLDIDENVPQSMEDFKHGRIKWKDVLEGDVSNGK